MPPLAIAGGAAVLGGGGAAISGTTVAWLVGGAAVVTAGAVAYDNRDAIADAMSSAETEAATEEQAVPVPRVVTCARCAQNPCAALACGIPGSSPYLGGAHGCMTLPVGDGLDSHHMPANSISPLPSAVGPTIQMDPRDHRMTNSYGASAATNAVLAGQQQQIQSGNFMGAQAIDVAEIEAKFPGKYTAAIAQMEAYTACLKRYGIIR